jgi:transposase
MSRPSRPGCGGWFDHSLFHDRVARLAAYRGIDRIGALVLVAEVCDWRRFESAHRYMAFCGLMPSEYSSGLAVRKESRNVVVAAIARELSGFVWAEITS